jgi:AMMECR1 domain-containing protein
MELTTKEKNTLLEIAKEAIAAKINNKKMPELKMDSENLQSKSGAFVTLK